MIPCVKTGLKGWGTREAKFIHKHSSQRLQSVWGCVLVPKCQKKAMDSTDNRTQSYEKPQKIIYFSCNRWLTAVMQPTFCPQQITACANPVLLMNLHSRSAQNCGIPLTPHKTGMASQGLRIHKPHAHRLAPNQTLLLVPWLSIYTVLSFPPDLQPLDEGAEPSAEIQCKSLPGTKLTDVETWSCKRYLCLVSRFVTHYDLGNNWKKPASNLKKLL